MRNFVRISLLGILIMAAWTACQRASEDDKPVVLTNVEVDSLRTVYHGMNDSVAYRWEVLKKDEDQKLANLNRLLLEISFTPSYNKAQFDSLKAQLTKLQGLRLDPAKMTDEQIDQYDAAIYSLKNAIVSMAQENAAFEQFPLMKELVDSINVSEERVLFYRVQYDNYASDLNQFIEVNQAYLPTIDSLSTPQKRKLFRLEE